jgi:hypothetical protein
MENVQSADAANMFHYSPLPSPNSIRLLRLIASSEDGGLRCILEPTELSQEPPPSYTALSYEWSDPYPEESLLSSRFKPITVRNGANYCHIILNDQTLEVHANLWKFLDSFSKLNSKDGSCFADALWIDAICINQADRLEKNHQVQLMGTIYSQADNVICWLGRSSRNREMTDLVQNQHQIVSLIKRLQKTRDGLSSIEAQALPDFEFLEKSDLRNWKSVNTLLEGRGFASASEWLFAQTYWSRLWIVQETILARYLFIMFDHQIVSEKMIVKKRDADINEFR